MLKRILGPRGREEQEARETCIVRSYTIAFLISINDASSALGKGELECKETTAWNDAYVRVTILERILKS